MTSDVKMDNRIISVGKQRARALLEEDNNDGHIHEYILL